MTVPKSKRDLFLAVLAMDAYQRGYDSQVIAKGRSETRLGAAVKNTDSSIIGEAATQAAGFYAISYDLSAVEGFEAGDHAISFRGTDYTGGPIDLWTGWTVGAGYKNLPVGTSQAQLTIAFQEEFAGHLLYAPAASNDNDPLWTYRPKPKDAGVGDALRAAA